MQNAAAETAGFGGAAQTHSQGRKRGESEDEDESRNIDAGCRRRKLCCAPVVVACLGICCGSRHTLAHPKWLPLVLLSCKYFLHPRPRVPSACVCVCECVFGWVCVLMCVWVHQFPKLWRLCQGIDGKPNSGNVDFFRLPLGHWKKFYTFIIIYIKENNFSLIFVWF